MLSVTSSTSVPVPRSVSFTVALGTAAPEESFTVTAIVPSVS